MSEQSESKVRLLYSRTNVFIQFNDDVCLPGVLCTFEESPRKYIFSWMSEDKISKDDMKIYREIENSKDVVLPDSTDGLYVNNNEEVKKNSIAVSLEDIDSFSTTIPTEWYVGIIFQLKNELFLPTFFVQKKKYEEDIDFYTELASWFSILGKNVYRTESDVGGNIYKIYNENDKINESSVPIGREIVRQENSVGKMFEEAKFNILLKFSKVTQKGKEAAAHILGAPVSKPFVPLLPKSFVYSILSREEVKNICDEYEAARQYLRLMSKDMQEKTIKAINQTINISNFGNYQKINDKDIEWHEESFITKIIKEMDQDEQETLFSPSSITEEENEWQNIEMPDFTSKRTGNPITVEQWVTFYDNEGRLNKSEDELRDLIYHSGLENDIRMDAWKYLLNIFPWDSTEENRKEINLTREQSYNSLKQQWKKILADGPTTVEMQENEEDVEDAAQQNVNAGDERYETDIYKRIMDRKFRIEKDVLRTDRTIPMYSNSSNNSSADKPIIYDNIDIDTSQAGWNSNLELLRDILITYTFLENDNGYVQGMSDLLAPILGVFRSESDSFWCFNEFMEKYKNNFHRNQEEMKNQLSLLLDLVRLMDIELYEHFEKMGCLHLFFCFRWLLIIFKREFDFYDCMRVWETMWSQKKSDYYQLFIAIAILKQNKTQILELETFDEILKYINNLANQIKVEQTLISAESLYNKFLYRFKEFKNRLIGEKANFMKKDQESGVVHMEVFNENGNTESSNEPFDFTTLAKNEILNDPVSIINRFAKLTTEEIV